MTIVRIPATFADDRYWRELPMGTILRQTRTHWTCDMDADTLADLKGDADYYVDAWKNGGLDRSVHNIARSAERTLAAIERITT
jgi:hypothetical protein